MYDISRQVVAVDQPIGVMSVMSEQLSNIQFVREVEKHEELYNYNLPGYSRRDIVDKAWCDVASKFNMTVAECKDKWRNLRTVYARKMKLASNGQARKAYYLADVMQFALPYIKVLTPNPSPSASQLPGAKEIIPLGFRNEKNVEDIEESASSESLIRKQSPPPPQQVESTETVKRESGAQKRSATGMPRQTSEIEVDRAICDYFKAKTARMEDSRIQLNDNEKKEAHKMFLLSLIPDLAELNDEEMRIFKRRVLSVIDGILLSRSDSNQTIVNAYCKSCATSQLSPS